MKDFPITIGLDDAQFDLSSNSSHTRLIGVVCQGVRMLSVASEQIEIDGNDATEKAINLVNVYKKHVQYILSDSITFGGFNIANINQIYEETSKPVISVTNRKVNLPKVKKALIKKFPDVYTEKLKNIVDAGNLYETLIKTAGGDSKIFFHVAGIDKQEAVKLLNLTTIDSKLPESVRMAHLIGKLF